MFGGDNDAEKRRTAEYISLVFPTLRLEDGFSQPDPLWRKGEDETDNAVGLRAQKVLDRIFNFEPLNKICKY